jgi:hypothetical protein
VNLGTAIALFIMWLSSFGKRNGLGPSPAPGPVPVPPGPGPTPNVPTPPWPATGPTNLPTFPSGWEPDEPPPPEVVSRAWALLPELWRRGVGTTQLELTGGRWITYQAAWHGPKKGVTAWRVKGGQAPGPGPFPGGVSSWTDDEMRAFAMAVTAAGVSPVFALSVYNFESGLNPHAENAQTKAQGLPQFMPFVLQAMGYPGDPHLFHELGVMAQLPWVTKLLAQQVHELGGAPLTEAKLFHLNLYPKTSHGTTVYRHDSEDPDERGAYAANKALDRGGKGFVDEDDLTAMLSGAKGPKYKAMLQQLFRVAGGGG